MLEPQFVMDSITTVGFPIAVTVYLLYERNRVVKTMNETMIRIETLIKERLK